MNEKDEFQKELKQAILMLLKGHIPDTPREIWYELTDDLVQLYNIFIEIEKREEE